MIVPYEENISYLGIYFYVCCWISSICYRLQIQTAWILVPVQALQKHWCLPKTALQKSSFWRKCVYISQYKSKTEEGQHTQLQLSYEFFSYELSLKESTESKREICLKHNTY